MKERFLSLGLAAVMAISLTTCGGSNTTEATKAAETTAADAKAEGNETADATAAGGVFKISGIDPVTDDVVVYGVAVQHDVELAVKEVNKAGGINGAQIEFNFQDGEHDAEKSIDAYSTLRGQGMRVLMGTVTSAPYIAAADKAAADSMFQTTPSGPAVECTAGPNVFRICFSDPDQDAASAEYIGENRLAPKVAVIYDNSDVYSSGIYEKFMEESANQGVKIVAAEAFTADSNRDSSTQLQKSRGAGAELIFLPVYYTEVFLTLQQTSTMGFAPQFFGCDGMDSILQVENFDTRLAEGPVLLTPFAADTTNDLTVRFVDNYKATYNEVPVQFVADAYDAIYATKTAIKDANITPDVDADTICDALETSMLNIRSDGLADEDMTWTEDGEFHKAPKAVRVAGGAYTAM